MKNIAVFTGSRAEFGLQLPLLNELKANNSIKLSLIIGASHVDPNFGLTINEIKKNGFDSEHIADFSHDIDSLNSNPLTIAKGIELISKELQNINPDLFIVYADRYESFAAVIASTQMGILTAHFEGGDVTEGGTFDDSVRHAMSKLSHLHFTTNREASKRIIKMGEDSKNVFTVGLPALDFIFKKEFTNANEIMKKYNLQNHQNIIVFTQHPIPIDINNLQNQLDTIEQSFASLDSEIYKIICTYPNSDVGSELIIKNLKHWESKFENLDIYESLGRRDFHGLLNLNNEIKEINVAYIGNSSAGIKETPALNCPSIILGPRQSGRLHSENVVFSNFDSLEISRHIESVFSKKMDKKLTQHYGDGNMAIKTMEIINNLDLNPDLLIKSFND